MGSIGGMSLLVALLPLLFLLQTEAQNACSNTCSVNDLEMHAGHCIQKFPRCPKRRLGCIENMLPGCGGQCFCMKACSGNPSGGGNPLAVEILLAVEIYLAVEILLAILQKY